MELALKINPPDQGAPRGALADVLAAAESHLGRELGSWWPSRYYLGNEFCQHLLPAPSRLRWALERAPVTLCTPPVNDQGLHQLARLLDQLPAGSEVVFSDWGVLNLIRQRPLVPVLGRMLVRNLKDSRLSGPAPLHRSDLAHPGFRDALRGWGVRRVEVDLPGAVLPSEWGLAGSLHFPFSAVASGRVCVVGSLAESRELKFTLQARCRKECRHYLAESEGSSRVRLFHRGNTDFTLEPMSEGLTGRGFDRLVYDPQLEFWC